jgi:putative oxidoreductase
VGLIHTLARLGLAWVFVYGGQDVFRHPEPRARTGGPFVDWLRGFVPVLPEDKILLVRANASIMVVAGTLLALGKLEKFAALALAFCLVPTTLAGHRFWTFQEPQPRAQQVIHVNKNMAVMGGLLLFALESGRRRR